MGNLLLVTSTLLGAASTTVAVHLPRASRALLRSAVIAMWFAIVVAVIALVREDTSYALVVDHTRTGLSTLRRVMGLWGGSSGSLLFFAAIVGSVLCLTPALKHQRVAAPVVHTVLVASSTWIASPFERIDDPPMNGTGLDPVLEHWAMLIHPPLLYLGLALALVPGLAHPIPVPEWKRAAIATLSAGLAVGGRWAHAEPGWGGWWTWDPVQNAALIPWLLLVASFHLPNRHRLAQWCVLVAWPAVFAGVALSRSSPGASVHAFAEAEDLRWSLWPLAIGALGFAIGIARRFPTHAAADRRLLLPPGFLITSAVVVALGTYRPFMPGGTTEGWFYARFLFPVVIAGLVAMGVATRMEGGSDRHPVVEAAGFAAVGFVATLLAGWTTWWQPILGASIVVGLGLTVSSTRARLRRATAHIGVLLIFAGALGATASTGTTDDEPLTPLVWFGSSLIVAAFYSPSSPRWRRWNPARTTEGVDRGEASP